MKRKSPTTEKPPALHSALLFHFCRVQLPSVQLATRAFDANLLRACELFRSKSEQPVTWDQYFENLYPLDWFVASACLEGVDPAWEYLFAARANRTDCLLVDALRRIAGAAENLGLAVVMLDVLDCGNPERVARRKALYESYGFTSLPSNPLRMFLPLATVRTLINEIDAAPE